MILRRLAVSSSAQLRRRWAWRRLEEEFAGQDVVLLAPTRGAAEDFVRECATEGRLGLHLLTPAQLASTLAAGQMAERRLAPLTRLGEEALAVRSVAHARKQTPLSYFEPVAGTPGFPRALAATLSDLRMAGLAAGDLTGRGAAMDDVGRLLQQFERELAEASLADLADLFGAAAEAAGQAHRFQGLPLLLLDVAKGPATEQRFLDALMSAAPVVATVASGEESALTGAEPEPLDEGAPGSSLERVQRWVFSPAALDERASDGSLAFFSAAGEGLECVEIARRIRSLAEHEALAFDRVAILLRNPDAYLPLVEDALRRARIPAFFTRGTLRPDPAGRAFLALLECAAEDLSASRFAEFLSLGQVRRLDVEPRREWVAADSPAEGLDEEAATGEGPVVAGTLVTPAGWEKLLVDAAVIGGRDRWERRLRGLQEEYRLRRDLLDDEEESARQFLDRQLERIENLERYALPIIGALDALPRAGTWGDWLQALEELARQALRRPESVESVLAELRPMADVGPVGLEEVRLVLEERLRFLRRDPPHRRYGGVFVGSIAEAAGRVFEAVFLPGLAEGVFPRRLPEDPLLLDEWRAQLGGGLPSRQDRLSRERQLLRLAAGAAARRLVVSYPRTDAVQGRARVPSFYALEVLRAAEGRLPELRALELRAAAAAPTRLGWPAPKDPIEAIDDAEHDLAVLEPLLGQDPKGNRGKGKYLIVANQHLARSLRARGRRWRNRWFESDGLVAESDRHVKQALVRHRLEARPYSASALQHFAACPYRFLLSAIHGLREREEALALEQMDPLTRGALFHEVQFRFFGQMRAAGRLPVTAARLPETLNELDRALDAVAAEQEEKLAPAIPRVWRSEIEGLRTDLRAWVRQLPEIHAEWRPLHAELSFGIEHGKERDPASRDEPVTIALGVRLRGAIDLVEADGQGRLRVTDHKTGKSPWPAPACIGGGEVLQPVLYAMAAERLLEKPAHSGMLYYCTQRGGYTQVEIPLDSRSRMMANATLQIIDMALEEGFLPAAPRKDACAYCDYRLVCGPYEETRVARKPKDRLEQLQQVRNYP